MIVVCCRNTDPIFWCWLWSGPTRILLLYAVKNLNAFMKRATVVNWKVVLIEFDTITNSYLQTLFTTLATPFQAKFLPKLSSQNIKTSITEVRVRWYPASIKSCTYCRGVQPCIVPHTSLWMMRGFCCKSFEAPLKTLHSKPSTSIFTKSIFCAANFPEMANPDRATWKQTFQLGLLPR